MSTEANPQFASRAKSLKACGAFGMAIDSDAGLPGLEIPSAVAGSRSVEHRLVTADAIRKRCEPVTLTRIGSVGEGLDFREYFQHASGGELMRTESYGEHLIADSGRVALSAVADVPPELWQRFVLGQVLPISASVQGLEIFHASAVSVDGGVIALGGPSGAGKSTLAGALISAGANFFVDDVLAVDTAASGITAYPGPGLMSLPPPQARDLGLDNATWMEADSKLIVELSGERRSQPIRAFVALVQDESAETPEFSFCAPNHLMALTFDALPRGPERLWRLLRVCAQLASEARAVELRFSHDSDPDEIATVLLGQFVDDPS